MIEAWRTIPKVAELVGRVRDAQVFVRMAAIELRRLAERTPEISVELNDIAQKLEMEMTDLLAAAPNDRPSVNARHDK